MASGSTDVGAVARGQRSVTALVEAALERVAQRDPDVQAFKCVDEAAVRARAKALDEDGTAAHAGLVVGVKDVIDTVDLPTEYGSPLFAGHRPSADADVVAKLRAAGVVPLGKTETTEFAMFQPTRTRNPIDLSRTPGGSSSGSAAAVADGMVHVALGTQTAGSVLRPAAYCGVYGIKPTRGWTSTRGIWKLAESLDTVGLFARDVADLRLLYEVLADVPGPAPTPVGPVTVAVLEASEWATTEPEVHDALQATVDRLRTAGLTVEPMAMPASWRELPAAHTTVMAAEVARNMRAALGPRVDEISPAAARIVESGDRCSADAYLAALHARETALRGVARLAATTSVVLAPSTLGVAPQGLDFTGDPVMCRPWTLLGLPAANVPAYRRSDGLPVGLQVLGLTTSDRQFLDLLAVLASALDRKESR